VGGRLDDDCIVTTVVVLDKTMGTLGHRDQVLARASDAEVLTVAVVAAQYFPNHLERALPVMHLGRDLSGPLSVSRFNRRRHRLRDRPALRLATLGAVFAQGEVFLSASMIESMPVPVCRRARARRWRQRRGNEFCGYCAAKREKFCGWRRHLVCTPAGVPGAFDLVPGQLHDLTPIHERTAGLPGGAVVDGDKAFKAAADEAAILADTGVRLVPLRRANMRPND
jgi:hypothetical protein